MRSVSRWINSGVSVGAIAVMLGVSGCSSTSLTNMWKDPSQPRAPIGNVLVVMLRKDATSRRLWEDNFVSSLKDRGVNATASYTLFPNAPPDTLALAASVRGTGYEGILTAHQLPTETETRFVRGYRNIEPVTYISPWTGQYFTYWSDVYSPGYIEQDRVVRYEVAVWTTRGSGRLVWTGTTATVNPSSPQEVNKEIAGVIVPELVKARVMEAKSRAEF